MYRAREWLRSRKHALGEALRDAASLVRMAARRFGHDTPSRTGGGKPRILIFDELLPDPTFGAGFPRAVEMLRAIVDAGWEATVYPMNALPDEYVTVRRRFPNSVVFLRGAEERGMRRLMRENIGRFDAVLISRPTVMERFVRCVASLPAFTECSYCIYDAEATFTAREVLRRRLFGRPMSDSEYAAALDTEVGLVRGVRAVISVTESEAHEFRARSTAAVHVISHTTPIRRHAPGLDGRSDLLFVGKLAGEREYTPNVDSLIWFVEEVMPLLDTLLGTSYRLAIAGVADDALVRRYAAPRIEFLGVVEDLEPWYDRSRVFIAPTRFAAGLPLKVVEAAAAGVPCVVTPLLAKQLGFLNDVECLVGGSAGAFADRCAALYRDPELWEAVRDAGLARIAADYSTEAFRAAVRRVLDASRV